MGGAAASSLLQEQISENPIMIYSTTSCRKSPKAKKLLDEERLPYECYEMNRDAVGALLSQTLNCNEITCKRKVPYIYICGQYIGGYEELMNLQKMEKLHEAVQMCIPQR